jgi:ribosome-associated translation inhibitor RaiA
MNLTEKIKAITERKVEHASRIFGESSAADVEYTEATNPRIADERVRVEITSTVHGQLVRAEASGPDDRSALDRAIGSSGGSRSVSSSGHAFRRQKR